MAQYRILSLDGGGAWALIQVKALIGLFSANGLGTDVTGHQVLKKFDLVVGNSGGTITIGGLIKNMTLSDLLAFFLNQAQRESIFVRAGFFADPVAHLLQPIGIGPKYDAAAKLVGLKAILGPTGEAMVADVPRMVGPNYAGRNPDVVFCAFDYDANREVFFRSNVQSAAASGALPLQGTVALAIHASSNAPLNYFAAPAQGPNHTRYWDGAIGGYNNPVLGGVVEALANAASLGITAADIWALSIGTANVNLPPQTHVAYEDPNLVAAIQSSTIVNDLQKMATSILDDPPDAASFVAHLMLGCALPSAANPAPVTNGRLIRMNPLVQPIKGTPPVPWVLPTGLTPDQFDRLARKIDMDAVEQTDVQLIAQFCDLWIRGNITNQGVRMRRDTLLPEIGHALYSQARAAWLAACP